MNLPLQLDFHGVEPSPAVAARIRAAARKLNRYHPCITSCRVVVETTERHHRRGHPYQVNLELRLPGRTLAIHQPTGRRPAVTETPGGRVTKRLEPNGRHKDLYVTIHDAFETARRRLEDEARRHRDLARVQS